MERVKARYDGEKVILLESVQYKSPVEVVVVFPDEQGELPSSDITGCTIAALMEENAALDFLHEPEEDIYSDEDLKVKYQ